MQSPVFCRSCRAAIDPYDIFRKACGADQRPGAQQVAPAQVASPVQPLYQQLNPQAAPNMILYEYARTYRWFSCLQLFGVFGLPLFFLGILLIIYAAVQKGALRRKVIEIGYDPEAWETPLRKHASTVSQLGLLIISTGLIAAGAVYIQFVIAQDDQRILPNRSLLLNPGTR